MPKKKATHRKETAAPAAPTRARRGIPWLALLLIVATFAAYLPARRAGWIWDDDQYVTDNTTLRSGRGLASIWLEPRTTPQYYPAVHTSFWVEYQLFGPNPVVFHGVNVALHAANAVLLALVLTRLAVPGAWIAGLLFALHPVEVESVAWVTERKNCLSGFFYLLSFLMWLRYRDPARVAPGRAGRTGTLVLAFVLFVLALLSKTVTATLPCVALVVLWWKDGRISRTDVLRLLPFFAVGIASGLFTAMLEREHVGAEGVDWALSPAARVLVAGRALWFYLGKLLLPLGLTFIYPRWTIDVGSAIAWLYPIAALLILAALWCLRTCLGRGPLAAALIFAGTLFPALGFFNVYPMRYSFVADHFQYLASTAVLAGIAAVLATRGPRVSMAVAGVLGAALGFATFRQCAMYRDARTLWATTLGHNPNAWIAHNNLGSIELFAGSPTLAEQHFRTSIEQNPRNYEAWNNLGNALHALGRDRDALPHYRHALEGLPKSPQAHANLGTALLDLGETEEAIAKYRDALRLRPDYHTARFGLAEGLRRLGRYRDALGEARDGLDRAPDDRQFAHRFAQLLAQLGDHQGAIRALERITRNRPEDLEPRLTLGQIYMARGESADMDRAALTFAEAAKHHPGSSDAWGSLAVAERQLGRAEESEQHFRRALSVDPTNAAAHANFAALLIDLDREGEAVAEFGEAARLRSGDPQVLRELAWLLATAKDPEHRSPARALDAAQRAVELTRGRDPLALDALAVAHAASGRFDEASASVRQALAVIGNHDAEMAATLREQLASFQRRRALVPH
jgi:tetratricopeptide (TPR) repeat protein